MAVSVGDTEDPYTCQRAWRSPASIAEARADVLSANVLRFSIVGYGEQVGVHGSKQQGRGVHGSKQQWRDRTAGRPTSRPIGLSAPSDQRPASSCQREQPAASSQQPAASSQQPAASSQVGLAAVTSGSNALC